MGKSEFFGEFRWCSEDRYILDISRLDNDSVTRNFNENGIEGVKVNDYWDFWNASAYFIVPEICLHLDLIQHKHFREHPSNFYPEQMRIRSMQISKFCAGETLVISETLLTLGSMPQVRPFR